MLGCCVTLDKTHSLVMPRWHRSSDLGLKS